MSFGNALRYTVLALVALAVWNIAYEAGRVSLAPAMASAAPEPKAPHAKTRDPWPDIVRHVSSQAETKARGATATPLPAGPFVSNIAELERLAGDGDGAAALALANGFRRCEYYKPPTDAAEMQQRAEERAVNTLSLVDQLTDSVKRNAEKAGTAPPQLPDVESMPVYRNALADETDLDANCRGVDGDEARKWLSWYAKAAELGDLDAQVGYWRAAFDASPLASLADVQREKADAAADLQRALARGDARALAAIAQIFSLGYYADPDPFAAHAYFFAASQGPNADISSLPWFGHGLQMLYTGGDTQTYFSRELRRTGEALDAVQIAQAEELGAQLYADCCADGVR